MGNIITKEQVEAIYFISKEIYEGKISVNNGLDILVKEKNVNRNSAKNFITNYQALRDGKNFHFTMKQYAWEYFLENIKIENGEEALRNAVKSFRQHLDTNPKYKNKVPDFLNNLYMKYKQD